MHTLQTVVNAWMEDYLKYHKNSLDKTEIIVCVIMNYDNTEICLTMKYRLTVQ